MRNNIRNLFNAICRKLFFSRLSNKHKIHLLCLRNLLNRQKSLKDLILGDFEIKYFKFSVQKVTYLNKNKIKFTFQSKKSRPRKNRGIPIQVLRKNLKFKPQS